MAAAIVLAAGASTRLGQPKQLVRLAGELLLERAVRVATEAALEPVIVVLGAGAEEIRKQWTPGAAQVVLNPAWAEGMGSSLSAGVLALPPGSDAVVVLTCDQPAVTAGHLRRLVEHCHRAPVASRYGERRGVPACFPASSFSQLVRMEGDRGARGLLRDAEAIELPGGELDIDSPAALEAARSLYG